MIRRVTADDEGRRPPAAADTPLVTAAVPPVIAAATGDARHASLAGIPTGVKA